MINIFRKLFRKTKPIESNKCPACGSLELKTIWYSGDHGMRNVSGLGCDCGWRGAPNDNG